MLEILTSLLILLNPTAAFFAPSHAPVQKDPPQEAAAFFNFEEYKLPLSENIFLAAQLIPAYPIRNWNVADPEISAKIGLVMETSRQRILWQKDGLHESRPIASLTKLMTALVVLEKAKPDDIFTVSKKAVATTGEMGGLIVGEKITVKNLLYALLVESSNDAAIALGENIATTTQENFINLMNQKAQNLGLADTTFADPSGLDPGNRSSAWDLNRLMQEVIRNDLLREIMLTKEANITSVDGKFTHHLNSTDELLGKLPEIIGGKTGYTEEAGNCMILAWRAPNNQGIIISVIMDSQDRMGESEALLKWTKEAFLW